MPHGQPLWRAELITPPTSQPVTLAEARDQARIELDCDDATLAAMIRTATLACEDFTRLALIEQTWKMTFDFFPGRCLEIPKGVLSVTSFNVIAEDDTATLVPATSYNVSTGAYGRLVLRNSVTLPTTERVVDGYEVTWAAGFGTDWNAVPQGLRDGILRYVTWSYEHRGDEILGVSDNMNNRENIGAGRVSGAEDLWRAHRRERIQ